MIQGTKALPGGTPDRVANEVDSIDAFGGPKFMARSAIARDGLALATTIVTIAALLLTGATAWSFGFPITRIESEWTPVRADDLQILALRMELVPSMDDEREERMWVVDQTMVVRNGAETGQSLNIALPNFWSMNDPVRGARAEDFWGEAFVNGRPAETDVVHLVPNPAHSGVAYRSAKRFEVEIAAGETAHIRLRMALPADSVAEGEERLVVPFSLRELWDSSIEFGLISLSWTDRMYAFRSNLPSYALYSRQAEWFVHDFSPRSDLEVRFMPQRSVFLMVADDLGCPPERELVDRVSEGSFDAVDSMLETYPTDVLETCRALPAAMAGSLGEARGAGLEALDLSQFAPEGSEISGPLVTVDPGYREARLDNRSQMYRRFLGRELERRAQE